MSRWQVLHWTEKFSYDVETIGLLTLAMPFIIIGCLIASGYIMTKFGISAPPH